MAAERPGPSFILKSFGLQEEDTREIRLDFQHLRRWRKTTEQIERLGWKAFAASIAALVSTQTVTSADSRSAKG
jgi:hypothetical protein